MNVDFMLFFIPGTITGDFCVNNAHGAILLILSICVAIALLGKSLLYRARIPPLTGWIIIGILLKYALALREQPIGGLAETIKVLGQIGVFVILFNIGLHSKLGRLLEYLGQASFIWIFNVVLSGAAGFIIMYYLFGFGLPAGIVVAVALTATSIGVSVSAWEEADALDTREGQLLLDVAELDDISSILLMALALAVIQTRAAEPFALIGSTVLPFLGRISVFILACLLFTRFLEKRLTCSLQRLEPQQDLVISISAVALIIASVAGLAGFSIALGAFFAGLAYSRDPEAVKVQSSFNFIYDLFSPFFFIAIGFGFNPTDIEHLSGVSVVLLLVAVLGKFVGNLIPALFVVDWKQAAILSLSMVPRAEITMVTIHQANRIAPDKIPAFVMPTMILVVLATSTMVPVFATRLLPANPSDH
ncbi:MAG: hypothetical protein GF398_19045 [Chitinivibrionales bacterium]|nr:hypothetical protein [Chitinivibrionales bacterium]